MSSSGFSIDRSKYTIKINGDLTQEILDTFKIVVKLDPKSLRLSTSAPTFNSSVTINGHLIKKVMVETADMSATKMFATFSKKVKNNLVIVSEPHATMFMKAIDKATQIAYDDMVAKNNNSNVFMCKDDDGSRYELELTGGVKSHIGTPKDVKEGREPGFLVSIKDNPKAGAITTPIYNYDKIDKSDKRKNKRNLPLLSNVELTDAVLARYKSNEHPKFKFTHQFYRDIKSVDEIENADLRYELLNKENFMDVMSGYKIIGIGFTLSNFIAKEAEKGGKLATYPTSLIVSERDPMGDEDQVSEMCSSFEQKSGIVPKYKAEESQDDYDPCQEDTEDTDDPAKFM